MSITDIANTIKTSDDKIILIYAFNATGKTRLSVEYKDVTKNTDGQHAGVYYNAYSEDLFNWDNDTSNDEQDIRLMINKSSLNRFHSSLTEDSIREKLKPYNPKFEFTFTMHDNVEDGIQSITFTLEGDKEEDDKIIKISRGEERIFIWCFFLALFEAEGWANTQSEHFFIDDPVSSLDDHNIFVTASSLMELIETYHKDRKIIITTHHIGFFSILANWLNKGGQADKYKDITKIYILNRNAEGQISLDNARKSVLLYHLHLMRELAIAKKNNKLVSFHFVLLRQVLENIASFLGVGQFSFVLKQIGIDDTDTTANILNILSHKNVFSYEADTMKDETKNLFIEIFDGIQNKYNFVLHEGRQP